MSDDFEFSVDKADLFHILHRAEQRAKMLFAEEARGLDLTVRQLAILDACASNEGLMQTEIVGLTGIDRSTVTELIGRMVKRGLLKRQRNSRDARAYVICISDEGRARLREAEIASKRAGARFLAAVPDEKQRPFIEALQSAAN